MEKNEKSEPPKSPNENSPEFLMKEYEHFTESLHKNEETGEKRVNFFISLTTVIIGGVITLLTYKHSNSIDAKSLFLQDEQGIKNISILLLSGLLVLGIVTFVRLLWRNVVTDQLKTRLIYISNELKNKSNSDYQVFELVGVWAFKGGLTDIIACMNSFILTVIVWIQCSEIGLAIISFISSFIIQILIAFFIRKREKTRIEKILKNKNDR